jgi:hypothetical protein
MFSFLLTVSAFAGKTYDGYVVLNNNTRIEGSIQMLSPTLNEVKVKFAAKSGKKTTYKAKEVKEYGFKVEKWNKEDRRYEMVPVTYSRQKVNRSPIAMGPTNVLIERQITGSINMYNHFVERNSEASSPFMHFIYVQKGNEQLIHLHKKNYKTVLTEIMVQFPELTSKIGTKKYGFKYISNIISTYNELESGNIASLSMR